MDYHYFGDSISFDTTYRTNDMFRPLGLFVGFNHHRNLIVLGAALLYEETPESFEWLFGAFLECMRGKHPKSIFSDQCLLLEPMLDPFSQKHSMVYVHSTLGRMHPKTSA
ncbi:Protein FAR1-RELATED SEQUENCE 7 [Linum grandiflorum]